MSHTTTVCHLTDMTATPQLAFRQCFGLASEAESPTVAQRVSMFTLSAGDVVLADQTTATRVVVNQHVPPGKLSSMVPHAPPPLLFPRKAPQAAPPQLPPPIKDWPTPLTERLAAVAADSARWGGSDPYPHA